MKTRILALAPVAALSALCACLLRGGAALSFPFAPLGRALRLLSCAGSAGNAAAVAVYLLLGLFPALALLLVRRKRALRAEDALLPVCSLALLAALWMLVNPTRFPQPADAVAAAANLTLCSLLLCWPLLRLLRCLRAADGTLLRSLRIPLAALAAALVCAAFGPLLAELLQSLRALVDGNTADTPQRRLTAAMLVLRWLLSSAAYLLDVWIILQALALTDAAAASRYSAETVAAAAQLTKRCAQVLAFTLLSTAAFNALQLLLIRQLLSTAVSVTVPLLPIALVLAALLLSRLLAEGKQLKDENDLMI